MLLKDLEFRRFNEWRDVAYERVPCTINTVLVHRYMESYFKPIAVSRVPTGKYDIIFDHDDGFHKERWYNIDAVQAQCILYRIFNPEE
jgi:hypothetical protein